MEEKHLRRIKVRRGSNLQRKQVLFEDGEFVYVNDIKKLYVGDVKKYGGHKVSNNNQVILKKIKPINTDIGDLLYNKLDKSTYIVNKDEELELLSFSTDNFYIYLSQIEELEKLVNDIEKYCCNAEFALDTDDGINILADYGDWIKVKDPELSIICRPPIISSKYLKLKTNKTYTLDILNANSDSDIVFFNNLIDRDTNDTPQNIKIVENSIITSSNLKILETTNTTIKFSVESLPVGVSVGMGVYIDYNIENDCGAIQKEKGSIGGLVYNTNVNIYSSNLDEYKKYVSGSEYNMYQIIDPVTKEYPWEKEGWFLLYFDSLNQPDSYYITMFDKVPTIVNGNVNIKSYIYGPIGPVSDKGMYMFYHPKNTDLNIWNKGKGQNVWSVFPIYNTNEHPNSPNRFFTKINVKPSKQQLESMFKDKKLTIQKDYTDIYKDTITPSFIKTF